MALSRSNVNYEVHVLQKGRWGIHARYPDNREKAALDEATELENQPGIDAVRVTRETYNPIDGSSGENIIFSSPGHKDSLSKSGGGSSSRHRAGRLSSGRQVSSYRDGGSGEGTLAAFDGSSGTRGKESAKRTKGSGTTSFTGLIIRILMVILFCVVVALVVTGISFPFLNEPKVFGIKMSSNARTNTLFVIFLATFFLTAVPIAKSLLSKARISSRPDRPLNAPPPPPAARKPARKKRKKADVIPSMPVEEKEERSRPRRNRRRSRTRRNPKKRKSPKRSEPVLKPNHRKNPHATE